MFQRILLPPSSKRISVVVVQVGTYPEQKGMCSRLKGELENITLLRASFTFSHLLEMSSSILSLNG